MLKIGKMADDDCGSVSRNTDTDNPQATSSQIPSLGQLPLVGLVPPPRALPVNAPLFAPGSFPTTQSQSVASSINVTLTTSSMDNNNNTTTETSTPTVSNLGTHPLLQSTSTQCEWAVPPDYIMGLPCMAGNPYQNYESSLPSSGASLSLLGGSLSSLGGGLSSLGGGFATPISSTPQSNLAANVPPPFTMALPAQLSMLPDAAPDGNDPQICSSAGDSDDDRSEHGDTTDNEMEEVWYWERLKDGVLAFPAPLQLQCLLFIIGDLYDYQTDSNARYKLSLLPPSIRRKLLLLLPALDVCRLEGTPATDGIAMEEIWRNLFMERMPYHNKEQLVVELYSPEDFYRDGEIECTWKDAYFNAFFDFCQASSSSLWQMDFFVDCGCIYDHFLPDLLYGIYSFNGDMEVYQCFSKDNTFSVHSVSRCAQSCPHLTPIRYYHEYESPATPRRDGGGRRISMNVSVDVLVNVAHTRLHRLKISSVLFEELWNCMKHSSDFTNQLFVLLSTVQSITVRRFFALKKDEDPHDMAKKIFGVLFLKNNTVKQLLIDDSTLSSFHTHGREQKSVIGVICPYLTQSTKCNLKRLEVHLDMASQFEEDMTQILQTHQSLEEVSVFFDDTARFTQTFFKCTKFIHCVADLLHRPTLKHLTFNCYQVTGEVSPDVVIALLSRFFSSPHPISISLFLKCRSFDPPHSPFTVDLEQQSKSIELEDCKFSPNLVSLLPPKLVLKSLKLIRIDDNTLCSFANLESIRTETFTLSTNHCITDENISDVCSLFRITTAKEWNLVVSFIEASPVEPFVIALSRFSKCLRSLDVCGVPALPILETVFRSLSPSKPAYFELGLSLFDLNEDFVKTVYTTWEKCGGVKLKKINLSGRRKNESVVFENVLLQMAIEVIIHD